MRIAIYGAGSLGIVLGAYLSKAGLDVTLVNRNAAVVDALRANGAVVTGLVEDGELETLSSHIRCMRLADPANAAGNNILANDRGAIVNPEFSDVTVKAIEDFLGVPCVKSTIAGCTTVGSLCRVTGKGCICHPDVTDEEAAVIEDVLKVEVRRTTVNHGSRAVGAGVLANSKGALVGDATTPIELGKIEDGLVLF